MSDLTPEERSRWLSKIKEWRQLGFDVDGLEDLLDSDYAEFRRRRLKMLKGQVLEGIESKEELPEAKKALPAKRDDDEAVIAVGAMEEEDDEEEEAVVPKIVKTSEGSSKTPILIGSPVKSKDDEIEIVGDKIVVSDEAITHGKPKKVEKKAVEKKPAEKKKKKKSPKPSEEKLKFVAVAEEEEEELPPKIITRDEGDDRKKGDKGPWARMNDRQKRSVIMIGAVVVVAIVLVAAIVYFSGDSGDPNGPDINKPVAAASFYVGEAALEANLSLISPTAGEVIKFDASASTGTGLTYDWTVDGVGYQILEGSKTSVTMTAYFIEGASLVTIKLYVQDTNGLSDLYSVDLSVKDITISIRSEFSGDNVNYNTRGSIQVSNPNGITDQKLKVGTDLSATPVTITDVYIDYNNQTNTPTTVSISNPTKAQDGFMVMRDVVQRNTQQRLRFTGEITTKELGTGQVVGSMDTDETTNIDLWSSKTVSAVTTNDLSVTITDIWDVTATSSDDVESYPMLSKDTTSLRLEDIGKEYSIGDDGIHMFGDVAYTWRAEEMERIDNKVTLRLSFDIDNRTKDINGIEEFELDIWVATGLPMAVRYNLEAIRVDARGTRTTIHYTNTLHSYTLGASPIYYGDSQYRPANSYTNYTQKDPTFGPEFRKLTLGTYMPQIGDKATSLDTSFSPQDAITEAKTQLPDFNNWISNKDYSYVVAGNYSAEGWNMSFGAPSLGRNCYNLSVSNDPRFYSGKTGRLSDTPVNTTSDLKELLTFSGAENIFRDLEDSDIDSKIFTVPTVTRDNGMNMDFSKLKFGVEANRMYPVVDLTSITNIQRAEYVYIVHLNDGSFEVALDALTGQLLYVWEHEDNNPGFSLFG